MRAAHPKTQTTGHPSPSPPYNKCAHVRDDLNYPSSAPVLPFPSQTNHTPTARPSLSLHDIGKPKGMKPTTNLQLRLRPLLLLLALLQQPLFYASAQPRRFQQGGLRSHWAVPVTHPQAPPRPGVADCTELYFEQPIDHFSYHPESTLDGLTFQQRYFVCGKQWWGGPGAPIFFYT